MTQPSNSEIYRKQVFSALCTVCQEKLDAGKHSMMYYDNVPAMCVDCREKSKPWDHHHLEKGCRICPECSGDSSSCKHYVWVRYRECDVWYISEWSIRKEEERTISEEKRLSDALYDRITAKFDSTPNLMSSSPSMEVDERPKPKEIAFQDKADLTVSTEAGVPPNAPIRPKSKAKARSDPPTSARKLFKQPKAESVFSLLSTGEFEVAEGKGCLIKEKVNMDRIIGDVFTREQVLELAQGISDKAHAYYYAKMAEAKRMSDLALQRTADETAEIIKSLRQDREVLTFKLAHKEETIAKTTANLKKLDRVFNKKAHK